MDSQHLQTWNEQHPVGTPVLVWPGHRDEAPQHSYVRNPAYLLYDNLVVYVHGYGNIALTHVERATGDMAVHARQYREECVRAAVRGAVSDHKIHAYLALAANQVLAEMPFFQALPAEEFDRHAAALIRAAMHRHLQDCAGAEAQGPYLFSSRRPGWPRPAALDHRQRFRLLMGPLELANLCAELALWLHGNPDKQPYKPEVVLVEKAPELDGSLWVTLAVKDASEAFGLGRNLGGLEQKGGPADE